MVLLVNRRYRVSFEKINTQLPGFRCKRDAQLVAKQLLNLFRQIEMSRDTFEFRARLKQLEYLTRTHQLDADFFWSGYRYGRWYLVERLCRVCPSGAQQSSY
jgi:hypothetical protein